MKDMFGGNLEEDTVIVFPGGYGSSLHMNLAVIVDPSKKLVWSATKSRFGWSVNSKPGPISREDRVVMIDELFLDSSAREALSSIREKIYAK